MNNAINGNVLEKYVQQRNSLQQQLEKLIYNKNISEYGRYNKEEEELREKIREVNGNINKFITIINKLVEAETLNDHFEIGRIFTEVNMAKDSLPDDLLNIVNRRMEYTNEVLDGKTNKDIIEPEDDIREVKDINYYHRKLNELEQVARDSISNSKLGLTVNKPSEDNIRQRAALKEIIDAYYNVRANLVRLNKIKENDPDNIEEINRLIDKIRKDKEKLPSELLADIENNFGKFNLDRKDTEKEYEDLEEPIKKGQDHVIVEPIEVVSVKKWDKKSKILVGLGIATVTAAAFLAYQTSLAITDNTMIQNFTNIMQYNSDLWHDVGDNMKDILHTSNIRISERFNELTGRLPNFDSKTGLWSVNGSSLSEVAKAAAQKVTSLTTATVGSLVTGAALIATGIHNKNKRKNEIEACKEYFTRCRRGEYKNLVDDVTNDERLTKEQKTGIFSRAKKSVSKKVKDIRNRFNTYDEEDRLVEPKLSNEPLAPHSDAVLDDIIVEESRPLFENVKSKLADGSKIVVDKATAVKSNVAATPISQQIKKVNSFFRPTKEFSDKYYELSDDIKDLNNTSLSSPLFDDFYDELVKDIERLENPIERKKLHQQLKAKMESLRNPEQSTAEAYKEMSKLVTDVSNLVINDGINKHRDMIEELATQITVDTRMSKEQREDLILKIRSITRVGHYVDLISAVNNMNNSKEYVYDEQLYSTLVKYRDNIDNDNLLTDEFKKKFKPILGKAIDDTVARRNMPVYSDEPENKLFNTLSKEVSSIIQGINKNGYDMYIVMCDEIFKKIELSDGLTTRQKECLIQRLETAIPPDGMVPQRG